MHAECNFAHIDWSISRCTLFVWMLWRGIRREHTRTRSRASKGLTVDLSIDEGGKRSHFSCYFVFHATYISSRECLDTCRNHGPRIARTSLTFNDLTFRFSLRLTARFHDLPRLLIPNHGGCQSLRMVRSRRKQLHLLRRTILFPVESKCVLGAQLFDKLLEGR